MVRSVGPVADSKEHWALTKCLSAWHCAGHPHCLVSWALCACGLSCMLVTAAHCHPCGTCLPGQMPPSSDSPLLCVQVLGPTSDEDTMLLQAADEQNAAAGLGPGSEGGSRGQGEGQLWWGAVGLVVVALLHQCWGQAVKLA